MNRRRAAAEPQTPTSSSPPSSFFLLLLLQQATTAAAAANAAAIAAAAADPLNATKAAAQAFLDGADALAAALAEQKRALLRKLDPGAPTTLVTSANGSDSVTCGRNRCYAPEFRAAAGGIAAAFSQLATNWTDTTTDLITIAKIPHVEGRVTARQISPSQGSVFSVSSDAQFRYLRGNGLPSTPMGIFPVQSQTAAYPYYAALPAGTDPSTGQSYQPNGTADEIYIATYNLTSAVPLNPVATGYYQINALIVGVTLTGAVWHIEAAADSNNNWYSPTNALPMDACWGHPYRNQYHLHGYSWKCFPLKGGVSGGEKGLLGSLPPPSLPLAAGLHSPLFGYALDGFGIFGPLDVDGKMITNARLDICHGHVGPIVWDGGKVVEMYHYHLNREYPFSVGCFRGK